MSGYRYIYPSEVALELYNFMNQEHDLSTFRKIQAVYLRIKFGYLPAKIAYITGLKVSHIRQIHSAFKKHGKDVLIAKKRGGRNRFYLDFDEEKKFLEIFKKEASKGGIVEIARIHKRYEELIGKTVYKSMIYKLLHRHGWRKIFPRPNHPNNDVKKMEAFKKTFPIWLP